jgi:hypothetical protein
MVSSPRRMGSRRVALAVAVLATALTLSLIPLEARAAKRLTSVEQLSLVPAVGVEIVTRDTVRVSGPPYRLVRLQHRAPGGRWRTVVTARTDGERTVDVAVRALRANGQWIWQASTGTTWRTAARSAAKARLWRVRAATMPGWTGAAGAQERVRALLRTAPGFVFGLTGPTRSQTRSIVPGVVLTTVWRGAARDGYVVSVRVNGSEAGSLADARTTAQQVRRAGFSPRIESVVVPAVADAPASTHYLVRVGRWRSSDQDAAQRVATRLNSRGVSAWADLYADDGHPTAGPWQVQALTVSPVTFAGTCVGSVGESSAIRETTSQVADSLGAIAGINGGFFDINGPTAFSGDPLGVSVVAGELVSEAVDGRTALVLDGCNARVTEVATDVVASGAGWSRDVDALNRVARGRELVLYTDRLGTRTPDDGGFEAVLDSGGEVIATGRAGRKVGPGQRVLHAVGSTAGWLRDRTSVGDTIELSTTITDLRRGNPITLTPSTHVLGGLVGLVSNGRPSITAALNGHASLGMVKRRHPRTLAGVTAGGDLVLLTVDGRAPTSSVGVSFIESAALLRWFDVTDGVALDGGGSTTMVVSGSIVNTPAGGAERAVGDGLFVVPRRM